MLLVKLPVMSLFDQSRLSSILILLLFRSSFEYVVGVIDLPIHKERLREEKVHYTPTDSPLSLQNRNVIAPIPSNLYNSIHT
jgi:hypothetical protein